MGFTGVEFLSSTDLSKVANSRFGVLGKVLVTACFPGQILFVNMLGNSTSLSEGVLLSEPALSLFNKCCFLIDFEAFVNGRFLCLSRISALPFVGLGVLNESNHSFSTFRVETFVGVGLEVLPFLLRDRLLHLVAEVSNELFSASS